MFKDAFRMQPDSTRLAGCTGCNQDAAWDVISNHDGFVTERSCSACPTGGWAALMAQLVHLGEEWREGPGCNQDAHNVTKSCIQLLGCIRRISEIKHSIIRFVFFKVGCI